MRSERAKRVYSLLDPYPRQLYDQLEADHPDNGFNPLNWDCTKQECYNIRHRPKLELFADCFPGKINFGDNDGLVEYNAYGLLLDWKTIRKVPEGQAIMFHNLTREHYLTVFIPFGCPMRMRISHIKVYWGGHTSEWHGTSLEDVRQMCRDWKRFTCTGQPPPFAAWAVLPRVPVKTRFL
jgi:hypothetical protein